MVVYRITNIKTKRVYIGSTSDFETRKREHLGLLRKNAHQNRFLQAEFNDYKEDAFRFDIILDGFRNRQTMLIKEYEMILKTKGYNYNIDQNCPVIPIEGKSKKKKSIWKPGGTMIFAKNPKKGRRQKPRKYEKRNGIGSDSTIYYPDRKK